MELRPASPTAKAPATNFTEADYERLMDINLKSAFFGTQFAAKQFIAQGDGGIVINISSVHEDWPMPGNVAYCVSKGGTRMLTRTPPASSLARTSPRWRSSSQLSMG
jgi:NAD(P)-dependent dehydrogenase (short-subunit alcohol dehydrogenase family)